ncbi:hypothetical protein [Nocardioides gilvus]|uniref:hypothetical protein n=1 Tax=Nocardioides gilvus TaxID=1735589 RepID=UPI000D74D39E|nr:hypothetical protein [Nocardioides gilvus]
MSTADLAAQEKVFTEVFDMELVETLHLDATQARTVFGIDHETEVDGAEVRVLGTPGVEAGVVLVAFSPASTETVRSWETRVSRDALKVIDFYAPDYEGAIARAKDLGYRVIESEASYELPEGTFREAHLWGPDNVVTAFLGGPADFFADFAQRTDGWVSEVQSISAPLTDAQPAVDFYRDVLGWEVVFEYAIDDPSFAAMVGVEELVLRSRNVGPSTREPYFGLIDYGLTEASEGTLLGRARAPRRGLLGALLVTDEMSSLLKRAGDAAGPPVTLDLLGRNQAVLLGTPHQVPHVVLGSHGN